MSAKWHWNRLGDHCIKIGSGSTPTGGKDAYLEQGPFMLIRSQNVYNDGFKPGGLACISKDQARKLNGVAVEAGDVLLNITGDSVARVFLATFQYLPARVNQHVAIIRPNPSVFDGRFVRYFLASDYQQDLMLSLASAGATRNALTKSMIENFKVPCPPIEIQRGIADTLSVLDDRITLLRETNATLEAVAQALFKSWFVDFDPVRAKIEGSLPVGMDEATAALFPDSFEESKLGLVPRGWRVGIVNNVADIKGGKQLGKDDFESNGANPIFGGAGEMGRTSLSNANGFVITVGRVGAYCGQFFWHIGEAWVNNNASHIQPRNAAQSIWIYQWLKSVNMDLIKKGAAQPFVSNGDIALLKMLIPTAELIHCFVEINDTIFKNRHRLQQQAQTLTTLRDTLLPRLISGQLRLPQAESATREALA